VSGQSKGGWFRCLVPSRPISHNATSVYQNSAHRRCSSAMTLFFGHAPLTRGKPCFFRRCGSNCFFSEVSAATQLDTRIPARDNHIVVSHGENHTHTQIGGCSALGSKGGEYRRDRVHNSQRRCHSDVCRAYLLCSRKRCL